jgi:hypothetical protein
MGVDYKNLDNKSVLRLRDEYVRLADDLPPGSIAARVAWDVAAKFEYEQRRRKNPMRLVHN